MADPIWYYARGEVERGPFTTIQIKALANAGKLRQDDLVWKEGMENWTSAKEVAELFPTDRPAGEAKPAAPSTLASESPTTTRAAYPELSAGATPELTQLFTIGGRACLVLGLLCVVLVRGCESLGERKVARLHAAAKLQAAQEWQRNRGPIAGELKSLQEKPSLTPAERDRLRDATDSLNRLDVSRASEELSVAQRLDVNRADAEYRAGAFMRGMTLHGGVLILLGGGIVLAMLAEGSDRWLGIGVLLIVCFSALASSFS